MIGSDDLIGKTTIDLEDRWFDSRYLAVSFFFFCGSMFVIDFYHSFSPPTPTHNITHRWQEWGEDNVRLPDAADKAANVRWQTKPLERRSLYQPSKSAPQGIICYYCCMLLLSVGVVCCRVVVVLLCVVAVVRWQTKLLER
jgi:hypothetical protein